MAKKKKEEAKESKSLHPREWSAEARREKFLKARKGVKADFRILEGDFKEKLVPYNHIVFDHVLALKGTARGGRIMQIHGDEGAGKTTTTMCVTANYQHTTNEPVAIFEYEPAASASYAYQLGVDSKLCFYEKPTSLHQAIKRHVALMDEFGVRFFVNDSIPFMRTKVERKDIESGKAFKASYGLHAKGMTEFYNLLAPWLQEYDATMLMVNQTRDRIDDDADNASKWSYTNKLYHLPGGRMARFAPSVMLELLLEKEIRPWEWGKVPDEKADFMLIAPRGDVAKNFPAANKVRVRTLKNKVTGMGFREGYIYIRPNIGIDENMSIRELACLYNIVGWDASHNHWFIGKSKDSTVAIYGSKKDMV